MMQYEIVGTPFPAVVCRLAQNESMHCESNGMAWMSPNMEMDTNTGGGIGKLFGRAFSGESLFRCTYTARTLLYLHLLFHTLQNTSRCAFDAEWNAPLPILNVSHGFGNWFYTRLLSTPSSSTSELLRTL